jgi:hypothetical protein
MNGQTGASIDDAADADDASNTTSSDQGGDGDTNDNNEDPAPTAFSQPLHPLAQLQAQLQQQWHTLLLRAAVAPATSSLHCARAATSTLAAAIATACADAEAAVRTSIAGSKTGGKFGETFTLPGPGGSACRFSAEARSAWALVDNG